MSHITDAITGDTLMRTPALGCKPAVRTRKTQGTPKVETPKVETQTLALATLCSQVYRSKRELQILSDTLSDTMGVLADDNIALPTATNTEYRRITREKADTLVESFKQELLKHDSLIAEYTRLSHSHIPTATATSTSSTPEE